LTRDEPTPSRLLGLLNTATPYAATSEAEVQARLAAAREGAGTETGDGEPAGYPPLRNDDAGPAGAPEAPPLPAGEELYADMPSPPAEDDSDDESFGATPFTAANLTPALARAALESDELRNSFTVRSPDLVVTVVGDLAGRILSLTIAEDTDQKIHVTRLARSVTAAVNLARAQSDEMAMELALRNHLGHL
jgi:hypothetical protein